MSDNCKHERTVTVHGKVRDSVSFQWPDGKWAGQYFGDVPGLISGDYIEVKVCLDCQKVQGMAAADEILALQPSGDTGTRSDRTRVDLYEGACQVCGELDGTGMDCPACCEVTGGGELEFPDAPSRNLPPLSSFRFLGWCGDCGEKQYRSLSGAVCENGHGGAETLPADPAKIG